MAAFEPRRVPRLGEAAKTPHCRAFTDLRLIGMFRPVAARDGRFVVLDQRLNDFPPRREGRDP
jgi:hypothetical protein